MDETSCKECSKRVACLSHCRCDAVKKVATHLLNELVPRLFQDIPSDLDPYDPACYSGSIFSVSISLADPSCRTVKVRAEFGLAYPDQPHRLTIFSLGVVEEFRDALPGNLFDQVRSEQDYDREEFHLRCAGTIF